MHHRDHDNLLWLYRVDEMEFKYSEASLTEILIKKRTGERVLDDPRASLMEILEKLLSQFFPLCLVMKVCVSKIGFCSPE